MKKRLSVFVLFIIFLLTACASQPTNHIEEESYSFIETVEYEFNSLLLMEYDEEEEQEQDAVIYDAEFIGEMHIHWDDGVIQYGSRIEGNSLVLYALENEGLDMMQLAVFFPTMVEDGRAATEWYRILNIFNFDVIDEWLILSVGAMQRRESARIFTGDIFHIKRDGSTVEHFQLMSYNESFIIIDGWIYHNIVRLQSIDIGEEGWHRIRPDGTDEEFLGNIYDIILFAEDGYIYGEHAVSGRGNLARWKPDSNEVITLFIGETARGFEDDFSHMIYSDIIVTDEYVQFTVTAFGPWVEEGRHWLSGYSLLYTADYRVDKNGGNLTLIYKKRYEMPPDGAGSWELHTLLDIDFVRSRFAGDTLREYMRVVNNSRAYELFSSFELFGYVDGFETWLFISENINGTYRYIDSFNVYFRESVRRGVFLADVDFDGVDDVLVRLDSQGNHGAVSYYAFLNRGAHMCKRTSLEYQIRVLTEKTKGLEER